MYHVSTMTDDNNLIIADINLMTVDNIDVPAYYMIADLNLMAVDNILDEQIDLPPLTDQVDYDDGGSLFSRPGILIDDP